MLKVYAFYDEKSLAFGVPYFAPTDGIALRSFVDLVLDTRSIVNKHPADFRLYCLGDYDERSGHIKSFEEKHVTPRFIAAATEFIKGYPILKPPAESDSMGLSAAESEVPHG